MEAAIRSTAIDLIWSPQWTAHLEAETVVLSAGNDRQVAIDGIHAVAAERIRGWEETGVIDTGDDELATLIPRLVDLGAIVPRPGLSAVTLVADDSVAGPLAAALTVRGIAVEAAGPLAIVARSGAAYPAPPDGAHLLADLSMHHTLALGPLVIPGLTSCIECLRTRVERRWPTGPVPPRPAMQLRPEVVAELLAIHVGLFATGDSPLVNATITWDFETGLTRRERLLRVPNCGFCKSSPPPGAIELPWGSR